MPRLSRQQVEAAQATIADQLAEMPEQFLDCRDPGLRHLWIKTKNFHMIPVKQVGRKVANLARVETCDRCGTVKTERFIVNNLDQIEKVGQTYDYPDGYIMAGVGVPRGLKRSAVVWTENYRRAMEDVVESTKGGKKKAPKSNVTPLRKKKSA